MFSRDNVQAAAPVGRRLGDPPGRRRPQAESPRKTGSLSAVHCAARAKRAHEPRQRVSVHPNMNLHSRTTLSCNVAFDNDSPILNSFPFKISMCTTRISDKVHGKVSSAQTFHPQRSFPVHAKVQKTSCGKLIRKALCAHVRANFYWPV